MVAFPNQLYLCRSKSSVILFNEQNEKFLLFKKQHFISVVDSNIFKNV